MYSLLPTTKQRNSGFTLVEIMIGTGVLVFLLLAMVAVIEQFTRTSMRNERQTLYRHDTALLERMLFNDLSVSFPMLGNLNYKDAKVPTLEFMEYFGSISAVRLPENLLSREFALDFKKPGEIELIVENKKVGDRRYFDPAQTYVATLSISKPGLLKYRPADESGFFTKNFPEHWNANGHFFFYAPGALQETTNPSPNLKPVRYYSFLGRREGNDIVADTMGTLFKTGHPLVKTEITNLDRFLRLLPSLGGSMAQVIVVPVTLVRYRIELDSKSGAGRVLRAEKSRDGYVNEAFMGNGINRIVFRRADVTTRRIDFKIEIKSEFGGN